MKQLTMQVKTLEFRITCRILMNLILILTKRRLKKIIKNSLVIKLLLKSTKSCYTESTRNIKSGKRKILLILNNIKSLIKPAKLSVKISSAKMKLQTTKCHPFNCQCSNSKSKSRSECAT